MLDPDDCTSVVIAPSDLSGDFQKKIACAWKLRKTAARCVLLPASGRALIGFILRASFQQAQDFFILEVLDAEE